MYFTRSLEFDMVAGAILPPMSSYCLQTPFNPASATLFRIATNLGSVKR